MKREKRLHLISEVAVAHEHALERVGVESGTRGQQPRLEGGQELEIGDQVVAQLGRGGRTDGAGGENAGAERVEVGAQAFERRLVTGHHCRERTLLGARCAAGYARVHEHDPLLVGNCGKLAHGVGQHGAVHGYHVALGGARQQAVAAGHHGAQLLVVAHADAGNIGSHGQFLRGSGSVGAQVDERRHRRSVDIVHRRVHSCSHQARRHGPAYITQSNETHSQLHDPTLAQGRIRTYWHESPGTSDPKDPCPLLLSGQGA